MNIQPDAVIRSAGHDTSELSDRRRISNERVVDFLSRGLMAQDAVYERYTQALSENLLANCSSNGPLAASHIRQAFHQLHDPETGYITKARFELVINERLKLSLNGQRLAPDQVAIGLSALFDILAWHAVFPFQPQAIAADPELDSLSTPQRIDEDGFFRAGCLLTGNPAPRYSPRLSPSPVTHRVISGTWGPHDDDDGWLVAVRGKDGRDFRRRLFRSLSIPVPVHESEESEDERGNLEANPMPTMISVPRFIEYQPQIHRDRDIHIPQEEVDEEEQQVVITADEDERSIDLTDILSECPPDVEPLTANPLRESYCLVTEAFPKYWQLHHLTELHISRTKLVSLLRLLLLVPVANSELLGVHGKEEEATSVDDLIRLVDRLDEKGTSNIHWATFDAFVGGSSETEQIANILSTVFSIFKAPFLD